MMTATTTVNIPATSTNHSRSRIIYTLPAGINLNTLPDGYNSNNCIKKANKRKNQNKNASTAMTTTTKMMMDIYTTALALYVYRTLFVLPLVNHDNGISRKSNNNNNQNISSSNSTTITIVMDVRAGGIHWPNIPAMQFIQFIRHMTTILPNYFPALCTKLIILPIPQMACSLYTFCIQPILDKSIRELIQLVPASTNNTNKHRSARNSNSGSSSKKQTQNNHNHTATTRTTTTPTLVYPSITCISANDMEYLESIRTRIISADTL
jgi:CRAL/TRIO domain